MQPVTVQAQASFTCSQRPADEPLTFKPAYQPGCVALATTASGIAALHLPGGGPTAHTRFKIPVSTNACDESSWPSAAAGARAREPLPQRCQERLNAANPA